MTRSLAWLALMIACWSTSGCLDSVLGVMLAPESVVAGAAGDLANAGAQTLANVNVDDLTNATQAVQDVDRILKNTDDPAARDRLSALRDKLVDNQQAAEGSGSVSSVTHQDQSTDLRRPADGMNGVRPPSIRDRLTVVPPEATDERRPPGRPDVIADNASLRPDPPHGYSVSLQPVRLSR